MEGENTQSLEGFGFDESNVTFFEETAPVTSTEEVIKEVVEDEIKPVGEKEKPTKEGEEVVVEEEPKFFEEEIADEDDEDEELDDDGNPKPADKLIPVANSISSVQFLKEKGLITYELEDGVELTEDLANEILEDNYDDAVDEAASEKIKGLPDYLKAMIKVALNGGNVNELLVNLSAQAKTGINKDTDVTVEANQVLIMEHDLRGQGYEQEYIDSHIQVLKDTGKLASVSATVKTKIVTSQEALEQDAVTKAEQAKEQTKENNRKYKADSIEFISTVENIKGVVFNKKDKETLPSFMSDLSVKMKDGRTITPYQQKLFEIFGDREKNTLLAKLVMNDFDFSSITNKSITEFSKGVRENIQNAGKDTKLEGSRRSSQTKPKKNLADLL